jgi:hypothetical protein
MARGEGTCFEHAPASECKDRYHRRCTGRWRGELNLGDDGQSKRVRQEASAGSKAELLTKLTEMRQEVDQGVKSSRTKQWRLQPRTGSPGRWPTASLRR